ncbi:helix-turn-helix transcriptional regulator [Hymenobacter busanensis]|uniref:Helix-turn-helix transcriptional regulator n=1 Tax=Hymenobacter busanensis TaxID=2607656 RepID=A0A7L4ZT17_9BACT|nr:helix-turn-helix transcriptional regulator [Hymenobacter busanensis]KAA9325899.1 helix-turn-helix transcriptional regulator [Hymenobacter busanensis]QHJ06261.1 hypothetical protein GUY19_02690 [Hymenobacter busanensis]
MEKQETVGQRVSRLIQSLGLSKNAFALSLDKTATVIQHIVEERNKPGFDLLCKIFEVYPNVSKDWLMQGNGPMLVSTSAAEHSLKEMGNEEAVLQPNVQTEHKLDSVVNKDVPDPAAVAASAPTAVGVPAASKANEPVAAFESAPVHSAQPTVSAVPPVAAVSWEAALYSQQLSHQLAMAELRNQHLQEQQKLMQQMLELLQKQR